MAKFLSQIFSEIRGSIAGQTFARNHNGAYVRARATPINPSTDKQSTVRSEFGTLASDWRGITESQRQDWITLAADVTFTDSLGQQIHLSGFQLYQKLNSNLLSASLAKISDAPAQVTMPTWGVSTPVFEIEAGTLSWSAIVANDTASGWVGVIEATDYSSAGRSFFGRSKYKFMQTFTATVPTSNPDIATAFEATYGPGDAKIGTKSSLRVRLVNTVGGWATPWESVTAILAEVV